jgi:hypothetical protein
MVYWIRERDTDRESFGALLHGERHGILGLGDHALRLGLDEFGLDSGHRFWQTPPQRPCKSQQTKSGWQSVVANRNWL